MLILPFEVRGDDQQGELQDFRNYVGKRIRYALDELGKGVSTLSEAATVKLLEGRAVPQTSDEAVAMASASGSDLVVYGVLSHEDSRYRILGVMWDLRSSRVSVSTDLTVANIHGLPGALEIFVNNIVRRVHGSPRLPFYRSGPPATAEDPEPRDMRALVSLPRETGSWRSPEIQTVLRAVDIGDVDGDGKNETVFVDELGVTISRFEEGGLVTLAQFSEPPAAYVSAEVEDINADGFAELILCYRMPDRIESAIVSYANRNLRVVARFPNLIMGTIPDPSDEKRRILLGQRTDRENIFDGEMVRFDCQKTQVKPAGKLMLPAGTLLLSYASGRFGKNSSRVQVILSQEQRLAVFDMENRPLQTLVDRIYGLDRSMRIPLKGGLRDIVVPGRLLIADTAADGESELLVIKQSGASSVIQGLVWDGDQLKSKWKTIDNPGIISDFRLRDFKNRGTRSLVLLLVRSNPFSIFTGGPRTIIYAYDLSP
jgi:hypothetical protein